MPSWKRGSTVAPEWTRDSSGTALKVTDAMLEKIQTLKAERDSLLIQNIQLREELMIAVEAALVP
jgi:hypothetical protein